MFEQKRLGDNGTSAATSKEEMDEKDGQVAHLAIVPISTNVTRLGTRWDLCDKSGIRHRQAGGDVGAMVSAGSYALEWAKRYGTDRSPPRRYRDCV